MLSLLLVVKCMSKCCWVKYATVLGKLCSVLPCFCFSRKGGKNNPLLGEVFEMTCVAQRLGPWLLFLFSSVICSFACYSGCFRDALKVHPCTHTSFEKSDRAENLCTPHGCKENWLSANSQLLLLWSPLLNALSGKTCRWPRHSYSQLCELEKRLHWGCYEDRAAETWMCPTSLWEVYAVMLTRLLPRDFLMGFGIGHMTPGNAVCASEVMSKHP